MQVEEGLPRSLVASARNQKDACDHGGEGGRQEKSLSCDCGREDDRTPHNEDQGCLELDEVPNIEVPPKIGATNGGFRNGSTHGLPFSIAPTGHRAEVLRQAQDISGRPMVNAHQSARLD
jgi:hypothetical protein